MSAIQDATQLKTLPLHSEHEQLGAKFGAFGEWYVPLYYTSILDEHEAVRKAVGIFDISHMGEFYIRGRDAETAFNRLITNDVRKLKDGQALYTPVCRENAGIVDDIVVMRENRESYFVVVNAANIEKDFQWFQSHLQGEVKLQDISNETALLAIQGPRSETFLNEALSIDLGPISYYHFGKFKTAFGELLISETGYTGELGFEIFIPAARVQALWKHLFEIGKKFGLKPTGFGARDTLRLEARFNLYGHDMTDETTPLEAGIGWTISWDKPDFLGKAALERQKKEGIRRKLIGFEMKDRGIARDGSAVFRDGKKVGHVASGSFSPTLKRNIGLAYVSAEIAKAGEPVQMEVRGQLLNAQIVKTPFYQGRKGTS